ncbi:MAG: type II toxin-antitoxin system RelE/ParE family toxin [Oligoflexia bacterium]|nr:type II toxin-antitoxin system RelE/ParE family toxin [Oligoflexia bacterium]
MKIKWTPKSEEDLQEIFNHVEKSFDSKKAKEVIINLINFTESTLRSNPLAGRILESNPMFSYLVFEGNLIFYCEHPISRDIYIIYVQPRRTEIKDKRLKF